jgi:hypothetical protein
MLNILRIVSVLFVVGIIAAGYFYVQKLQNELLLATANTATLQANAAALESAVATNEATIAALQEEYEKVLELFATVDQEFAEIREQNRELSERFEDADLGRLTDARPGLIENIVNRATDAAGRCFELLSGAPLNDQERNATNGREFNQECPWLWPGADAAQ